MSQKERRHFSGEEKVRILWACLEKVDSKKDGFWR